jgi:NADH-quinone oxidoreductase subunit A|tara:strand:+ start:74 stop:493 length:420 start_codon:yes stop_codon:yes gene_type:complete
MYQDFLPVAIFIALAIVLLVAPLAIQALVSPRFNKKGDKLEIYECGEIPEGSAWVQFNIRFYIIALIFIIFDVEVVFLFPWAVVFKDLGLIAFVEVTIFLGILIVGFAYVWMKGDLDWVKMKLKYASGRYADLDIKETD